MSDQEINRLLSVLDRSIRSSGFSQRKLERFLGLSQGYLASLLKGRIKLKVAHIYDIADALHLEPLSLFLRATPPRDPDWLLSELGIRHHGASALALLMGESWLPPGENIENVVRKIVKTELTRLLGEAKKEEEDDVPASSESPPGG